MASNADLDRLSSAVPTRGRRDLRAASKRLKKGTAVSEASDGPPSKSFLARRFPTNGRWIGQFLWRVGITVLVAVIVPLIHGFKDKAENTLFWILARLLSDICGNVRDRPLLISESG